MTPILTTTGRTGTPAPVRRVVAGLHGATDPRHVARDRRRRRGLAR